MPRVDFRSPVRLLTHTTSAMFHCPNLSTCRAHAHCRLINDTYAVDTLSIRVMSAMLVTIFVIARFIDILVAIISEVTTSAHIEFAMQFMRLLHGTIRLEVGSIQEFQGEQDINDGDDDMNI